VAHEVCASLPCALGPEGASLPLFPPMSDRERGAWDDSLATLAKANARLPA
jgi:malate/lactate dehydrogenase